MPLDGRKCPLCPKGLLFAISCQHKWGAVIRKQGPSKWNTATGESYPIQVTELEVSQGATCSLCGASRGAYGLEPTVEMYVSHTIEVLRAIRRVLKGTGVCFINLGDSYAANYRGGGPETLSSKQLSNTGTVDFMASSRQGGLKPLDMALIPQRVALAAQADGWWVRSIVVWAKPNPMPESVQSWRWERHRVKTSGMQGNNTEKMLTNEGHLPNMKGHRAGMGEEHATWADCPGCPKCEPNDGLVLRKGSWRPTSSYEVILMLTKTDGYFGDGEEVKEPLSELTLADSRNATGRHTQGDAYGSKYPTSPDAPSWYRAKTFVNPRSGRNLRDVWTFSTHPEPGAHFATYPEELVEKCVLSSTSAKGNCPKCGAPWARVVEKQKPPDTVLTKTRNPEDGFVGGITRDGERVGSGQKFQNWLNEHPPQTLCWRPTCQCGESEAVPATVLDPFVGSGTTCAVAKRLGRQSIGIDLSEDYLKMAAVRVQSVPLPMRLE